MNEYKKGTSGWWLVALAAVLIILYFLLDKIVALFK